MSGGSLNESEVRKVLDAFLDPETGRSVARMDQVRELSIDGNSLAVTLALTTHSAPLWDETRAELKRLLVERFPGASVEVRPAVHERPPQKLGEIGLTAKSVIAVGSGKGGVGKSTIAVNLAYGLKRAGCFVGLMDADVYGPSIPHLVGIVRRPEIEGGRIQPIEVAGLKLISMGFLVPPDKAVVWRGPMLHGAITQFLRDTAWGDLDYLIIDLPPGTGDIALTLSQLLPLTGAIVVCTPQDVALADAIKAIGMFRQVNIPLLGMVENMSYFDCPDCGKSHEIFGHGGARQRAETEGIPFLGEVPIQIPIRRHGDEGDLEGNYRDAASAPYFEAICRTLVRNLAQSHRERPPLPSLPTLG